jgi:sec-independent protein translocase protein TatC
MDERSTMSISEHLEELRSRLFIMVAAYLPLAGLAFWQWHVVIDLILAATGGRLTHLAVLSPAEALFTAVKIGAVGGLVLASPIIIYQLYAFVAPGLNGVEREIARTYIPVVLFLFFLGIAFGYTFFLPLVFRFMLTFNGPGIAPVYTLSGVVGFAMNLVLPFGFVFEFPVVVHALARLGIVSPVFLRRNRRYAILVIFILAAMFTPPDAFSMLAMVVPMLLLYEAGVLVSGIAWRRYLRQQAEAAEQEGS